MAVEDLGEGLKGPRPKDAAKGQKRCMGGSSEQPGGAAAVQPKKKAKQPPGAAADEDATDEDGALGQRGGASSMQARLAKAHTHVDAGQAGKGKQAAPTFIAAQRFSGARPGYCFRRGNQGLGYYVDKPPQVCVQRWLASKGRCCHCANTCNFASICEIVCPDVLLTSARECIFQAWGACVPNACPCALAATGAPRGQQLCIAQYTSSLLPLAAAVLL